MHFLKVLSFHIGFVGLLVAAKPSTSFLRRSNLATNSTPTIPSNGTTGAPSQEPCGIVNSLAAAALAANPKEVPRIDAQLAHDCLDSVPLDSEAALKLVEAIEPYIEWHSDLPDLKDPPKDYFFPPLDVQAELASVKSNLTKGVYVNEYAFQQDLYRIFNGAHNGHLYFYPDLLTKAFEWRRKRSLVSISSDGVEIPKIYLYDDIISDLSKASEVTKINGVDAVKYVEEWAFEASGNQDADTAYNTMFFEKAFVAAGITISGHFSSGGRYNYVYPGSNTTLSFANGTSITDVNSAVVGNFTGVTDGKSFYQKFCNPNAMNPSSQEETPAAAISAPMGYPMPVVATNDSVASGYYLDSSGVKDVAVLSLLSFSPNSRPEWQAMTQTFLEGAVRDGKRKLIIDLSANSGGVAFLGYDLFRMLFPQILEDGFTRIRENDAFMAISRITSADIPGNFDPNTASADEINKALNWFNFRYDYNLTSQPFLTFEDKFAPRVRKGTDYTNIIRWNLEDPFTTSNDTFGVGIDISGYRSRKNLTQHFAAEDIVMLYDGYCASTCTLFSEFMRVQGSVKSIAMGGRANKDPIQGVGGVKGAQVLSFSEIFKFKADAANSSKATREDLAILDKLTTLPMRRSIASSVNFRDNILRDNLKDGLPAQFVYEKADCRLYWTAPMIKDVKKIWEAAANAAWNGAACVAGGFPKREANTTMERTMPVVNRSRAARPLMIKAKKRAKDPWWRAKYGRKVIN